MLAMIGSPSAVAPSVRGSLNSSSACSSVMRVHLLSRAQAGEPRLLLVVLGADLHERAEASHAHGHRLAADRIAAQLARLRDLFARDVFLDVLDLLDEGLPELRQRRGPRLLAARDRIEFIFHVGGEAVVDVLMKVIGQEAADDLADVGGREAAILDLDVFAIAQRRDDRSIGRGAADAVFLQRLDQRGLGEARRRFGEVLLRVTVAQPAPCRPRASPAARDRCRHRPRRRGIFLIDRDVARRRPASSRWRAARDAAAPSGPASMSTATVSNTAGAIWQATARFQISE